MKKTVFITGASRGLGKSILDLLRQDDYEIIAPPRKDLDLSNKKSIESFIRQNKDKKIDIIINNAGINLPQWIQETTDENIQQTMQINLVAPIMLVRGLVTHMKNSGWGRIVNISSAFSVVARGKQVLYTSSKHGLNGFTKALALELAQYNILVNSVSPGFTATELVLRNPAEKIAQIEKDIPLGRLAQPNEIAALVNYLISEKNTYITGTNIIIDGGFVCK